MITIDLTKRDCVLYKGCVLLSEFANQSWVEDTDKNRFVIVRNVLDYLESKSREERNRLVIVGEIANWLFKIIRSTAVPFCGSYKYQNSFKTHLPIPSDPSN